MAKEFNIKIIVDASGKNFKKENKGSSDSSTDSKELSKIFNGGDFKL